MKSSMTRSKAKSNNRKSNGANLGFEEKLWQAADKMRGHMDPAEYKHVVLWSYLP
jgi:type I restriction enzyme M protein